MSIGERLPPIPVKLVKKIESGKIIELTELLPDQMGIITVTQDLCQDIGSDYSINEPIHF